MHPRPALRRWTGPPAVAALLLAAWVALALSRPPAPPATDPGPTGFWVERAWRHVEEVARSPRAVGTARHGEVRAYLLAELAALGLEVDTLTAVSHAQWGATVVSALTRNVAARLSGTTPTGAALLMSHYDAVPLAPGAGDAGIGVATVLETARALTAGARPRNDVIFLLSDAEELGLLGARVFAERHPWVDDVRVVLNFEARGLSGPAVAFETGPGSGWAVRELGRVGRRPVSSSLLPEAYARMPNDTDFTVFLERGLPGLNFAIGESAQWYHTPGDRPENLSPASLQHMGDNALAMARHLAERDLGALPAGERLFFFVPGLGLLGYGPGWVVPLAVGLVLAFAGAVGLAARRRRLTWWGIPAGFLAAAVALVGSILLAHALWSQVQGRHPELGAIVGRALYREWPYILAVVALTVAVFTAVFGLLRRWVGLEALVLGAILIPVAAATASAVLLPAASPALLWASMVAVIGAGALARDRERDRDRAAGGAGAGSGARTPSRPGGPARELGPALVGAGAGAGVVALMVPLLHIAGALLGVAVAPLLAALSGLLVILLLPLLDVLGRPHRAWLPLTATTAAAGLVAVGLAGARPAPDRPAPANLVHVQDADTDDALWAAPARHGGTFLDGFFDAAADTVSLAGFSWTLRSGRYRTAPAPAWAAGAAVVRVLEDGEQEGARRVRVTLEWADPPATVEVSPGDAPLRLLVPETSAAPPRPGPGLPISGPWRVTRAGLAHPLELVLEGPPGEPITLTVTAHYPGLPEHQGQAIRRPPEYMAVPAYRWSYTVSDTRLVRSTVTF